MSWVGVLCSQPSVLDHLAQETILCTLGVPAQELPNLPMSQEPVATQFQDDFFRLLGQQSLLSARGFGDRKQSRVAQNRIILW
jgi:hypothetical protein